MLDRVAALWRPRPVTTVEDLGTFLTREATFLSQKATIDYCRARAGLNWQKLASEPAFFAALKQCRWESMANVLADMIVITEGFLRTQAGQEFERLAAALVAAFVDIMRRSLASDGSEFDWKDLERDLAARLARAQMAQVRAAADVARTSGDRVYELLPIHPSLRTHDREMIVNHVRFGMVAFAEKLARTIRDPADLARQLRDSVPAVAQAGQDLD